ncbi:MAG: NADH:flavin oxidoreductase/NADH oxidase [Acidobacteriota bacterium]
MSNLFKKFRLREVEFRNRIFVSPMCQYSSKDGLPNDWHLVHLGSRAIGGAALVMVEASAVTPAGRITPWDMGIWSQDHAQAFQHINAFLKAQGAVPAIQLAHAGRKASTDLPWRGGKALSVTQGGWQPLAPSPQPFDEGFSIPKEMTQADIDQVVAQFVAAAQYSLAAGFEVIELHMAHGYLVHEFLSPLTNHRKDRYGGNLENRTRLGLQIAEEVRRVWPAHLPLFVRISATDWTEGGWDLPQSIQFARWLKERDIDLIDCSSGGIIPRAQVPLSPGYQVPFAAEIRQQVNIATGAVGLITQPYQAEQIINTGQADVVFLARELLRQPYWPLQAAHALSAKIEWPLQYARASY